MNRVGNRFIYFFGGGDVVKYLSALLKLGCSCDIVICFMGFPSAVWFGIFGKAFGSIFPSSKLLVRAQM